MKKLSLIIMSVVMASAAIGQGLVTSTYVETTSVGPKAGIAVGAVNQYGGFYQESKTLESLVMSETTRSALPHRYERVFAGLYFSVPVTFYNRGEIKFNVRTGVVNKESFIITPSLLADYRLNNLISIGGGVGVRNMAPTIQTKISFTL